MSAVLAPSAPAPATDLEFVRDAWSRGWTIPPPLTLSEWADTHRILPRSASSEPGRWRTDRTPYLREIMDCLSEFSPVREVNLRKSTQVGGTEVGINWISYIIDHCPGPAMVVMPTVDVAQRWSKQRLAPIIEAMPCLRDKIAPARSRDSGNTTLLKEFPGGLVIMSGANSSASLRSMPIRFLFLDELDEYPGDLNEQGSAQEQAERRTANFARRKIFRCSTPTVRDASAIDAEYLRGDQRTYHVPCPDCGHMQALVIDQLTDDGEYICGGCGVLIPEHAKPAMLAAGKWVARHPGREIRSYHIWSAYSPLGLGYSWREIAEMRAAARARPELMVTFTNTILGESYEGLSQKVEATEIADRAGAWPSRTIPRGCLLLTAGVDVQHNRFAVLIAGWGRNETCWIIDYVEIPGDPTREEDWRALDERLQTPIMNASGIPMRPAHVAIDTGNWTHDVYRYVRPRQPRGVIAIKGASTGNKPIIARASRVDVNARGKTIRHGVQLWLVGTDTAKTTLMQRLIGDIDVDQDARRMHFPSDLPPEFYQQLTAERYDTEASRWLKPKGARNEALDCLVYAYAAAVRPPLRIHVLRESDWAALEAKMEPPTADLFSAPAPARPGTTENRPSDATTGAPAQPLPAVPAPPAASTQSSAIASSDWTRRL